ncbi:MAG: ISKra4 family transposase [Candidatus Hydrogenedentes bacterium]|nr:ISKra4 family transposase [Candidatus Hydrogenedentota bacterium]
MDLEAVEQALRTAVLEAGARVLERLLESVGVGRRDTKVFCPRCAAAMESRGTCAKNLLSVLGWVRFSRSRYVCPRCQAARFPGDEALGMVNTSRSPGVQRLEARFGAKETFKEVADDLGLAAGIAVSAKDAERVAEEIGHAVEQWVQRECAEQRRADPVLPDGPPVETLYVEFDGTGIPMVPAELAGRKGKQPDGSAKTREVKLGCVFTQIACDDAGRPIRDPASTTFVGAIESAEQFGWRIYGEARRRGMGGAGQVVTITDGAEWARNLAVTHFPHAEHIVDFYHAAEHVTRLVKLLYERNPKFIDAQRERWTTDLYEGRVQNVIAQASALLPKPRDVMKDARKEIAYLAKNKDRMKYDQYRARRLFIGSGVIEAGCKHLIGHRLKQSGMEWTLRGANAIIALRCTIFSRRFEDFWEQRLAPAG